jgi:hypothetical protein
MRRKMDDISKRIFKILETSYEPLETKEIEILLKNTTRTKALYRLNMLRGDGLIHGKPIGSGKGSWIWWDGHGFNLKKTLKKSKK